MQIYGTSSVHGPHALLPTSAARSAQEAQMAAPTAPRDEVEISEMGQLLESISTIPEMRFERIAQIRSEIARGAYDSDAKLQAALERLLDEIG